jgi:hypothetical protein
MPGSALTRRGLESGIVVYFRNQVDYVRSLYLELPTAWRRCQLRRAAEARQPGANGHPHLDTIFSVTTVHVVDEVLRMFVDE